MDEGNSTDDREISERITSTEEKVIQYILTIALPLIITLVAFGVIVLAFSGWKLY